ncbi:MAG: S41 family peptidase, partial [Saprospiraceae bacterium]
MKILKSRTFQLLAIAVVLFTTVATTVVNTNSNYFEIAKNIEIFTNLYKEVNTGYVDELDPAKLMKTGVDAML